MQEDDGMTTFMVLMAGLALGSDGTERISTETEQCLDIEGYWEGIMQYGTRKRGILTSIVKLESGRFNGHSCSWVDDGQGKCQFIYDDLIRYGIYQREPGRLIICFGELGYARPIRFHADQTQDLLILKPANPPKK
jgi:hypothetical protein